MRQLVAAVAAAVALAGPAAGQRGLSLEVRGGAGVGNYAEAATDFQFAPRPAFGVSAAYAPTRVLEVYAGYSRTAFGCDMGFCSGRDMTFTSSGVDAGVRLSAPVIGRPWLRAGIVSHTLDYDSSPPEGEARSGQAGSGTGFDLGAGVEVRLGRMLAVTPGVRYLRYGAAGGDGVAMLVGDVGLRIRM